VNWDDVSAQASGAMSGRAHALRACYEGTTRKSRPGAGRTGSPKSLSARLGTVVPGIAAEIIKLAGWTVR
jgi:hypothetical protein